MSSAVFAFLTYRHNKRVRREDLADKKQLIHYGMRHSWPNPKPTPENETVELAIANRTSGAVTIKEVVWCIGDPPTVWALEQKSAKPEVAFPAKLEPSDEIVLPIDAQNIFRIPWLNQEVPWYDKVFFIKSVRARITLTTGQEYICPLLPSLRSVLVTRHVGSTLFKLVGRWYANR